MKRLVLIGCVLLSASACSDSSPVAPSRFTASAATPDLTRATTPKTTSHGASLAPLNFRLNSQSQTVRGEVVVDAGVAWVITSDVPWLAVGTPRGHGPGPFTVRVDRNMCDSLPRRGHLSINIDDTVVTIWQDGTDLGLCR